MKSIFAGIAFCILGIGLQSIAQDLPPDSEYVVVKDGHLYQGGKRIRFWGGIGAMPAPKAPGDDIYARNKILVQRLLAYGFNMHRIWGLYRTAEKQGSKYTKGDGSRMDMYHQCIAEMKKAGMKLWVGAAGAGGRARQDDVDIIDDPATAAAWKEAVGEKGVNVAHCVAIAWDPRLEAIAMRNTRKRLDVVNQHTGLRLADDPVFAVWELTNEQWWIVKMVSGKWQKLPKFFRDSLLQKWHEFLKDKYKTQAALTAKWSGLKPGEDLVKGTIYLAPLRGKSGPAALNDANPHASAKFKSEGVKYGREDFSAHRARDVNEFFAGLILSHKQRLAAALKKCGKSTRLSPCLYDTGIGYNGISQLLHQNADAVSHCAYIGGWTPDTTHKRYPWYSGLEEPPRICLNVPWLEHNKVENKPFFCYETQIGNPAKFRAEFPYRILFLATVQDWDIVCWHTLSGGYRWNNEDPFEGPLSSPGHAAVQFNYQYDQMQLSAMHAAGKMFTSLALKPAPKPTKFIYGRKTIFSPESMDYAGSYGKKGMDMLHTSYRYGCNIEIDLTRDDNEIQGPTVPFKGYAYPSPLTPTDQMVYDWHKGCLTFDTPANAAFVGFLAQYDSDVVKFDNGVTISKVSVDNPPEAPYPVTPDENYVAIAVTSTDGRSLNDCRTAMISAVSTSANKGLKVGRDPKGPERPRHVWEGMKIFSGSWKKPQIHSRVNCTITAPALAGMTYRMLDWHLKPVAEGKIGNDGKITIKADDKAFIVELKR